MINEVAWTESQYKLETNYLYVHNLVQQQIGHSQIIIAGNDYNAFESLSSEYRIFRYTGAARDKARYAIPHCTVLFFFFLKYHYTVHEMCVPNIYAP